MSLYLDSAYVAKCYINEADAESVRALVADKTGLCSSALCLAEMACIFQRHLREQALTRRQMRILCKLFQDDVDAGVWNLVPVGSDLLAKVQERVGRLAGNVYVRAGEAIHLVTAKVTGFSEIWTNDRHMLLAAPRFGLIGRSVSGAASQPRRDSAKSAYGR